MKRRIAAITILVVLMLCGAVWARGIVPMVAGQRVSGVSGYCSGTELFCSDFETTTSWDATNGASDCDGYDSDGDYCDGDTTTYKNGAKSFGVRGADTYYVRKNLSSTDQSELYIETWFRVTDVSGARGNVGVYTSNPYHQAVIRNSWGTLQVLTKGGSTALNTSKTDLAADTWYHVGVYIRLESTGAANDGIVRAWVNTDGGTFDAADVVYNSSSVDTGASGDGYGMDLASISGPVTGHQVYADDFRVVSGSPAWLYE